MENFNLEKIKNLSLSDSKKYIDKYFIPLTNGEHAFYINGQYEIMDDAIIKRTYFKRMSSELQKYYFQDKSDLKTISYDVNEPIIYNDFLNLCPKIKQTYKKYSEISTEIKNQVEVILKHILEVYCSNRKDSYNFLLKWFSNMVRGNRNDSALYLKGPQGCGKSSIVDDFLRQHVIGKDLSYQGGSEPLKNHFNSALSGKLMVLFEELENMSVNEWISVSCKLKRQITSKTIQIERKGKEMRDETNLNNYILLSNNDAIQDDDGRRYFILDINPKYTGNKEYFKKLHSCFSDEVGQAFYSYLMELDLKDYNAQSYPMTQSKLDSFSKRLDIVYQFIKDEYILKSMALDKIPVKTLFSEYEMYSSTKNKKAKGKIDFKKTLENVGIECYKSNNSHKYNYSLNKLKEIADKYHWIHELDYDNEDDDNGLDNGVITSENEPDYKKENEELKKKLKELEEKIKLLQNPSVNVSSPLDYGVENIKKENEENEEITYEDLEKELESIVSDNSNKKIAKPNITIIDDISKTIEVSSSDILDLINDDISNIVKKNKKSKK
jgi:heat shock protein HspQ